MSRTQWLALVLCAWLAVNALLTLAFSLSGARHRRRGAGSERAGRDALGGRETLGGGATTGLG